MARSITMSGQSTIMWSAEVANSFLNNVFKTENVDYVLAIDTDSNYLNLDILYSKIKEKHSNYTQNEIVDAVDKFCILIQAELQRGYDQLYKRMNGVENRLEMKRENIGAAVFYQKKRYFMRVYDQEGERFESPKAKVMGLEAVRSTTPEWARQKLKETYMKVFELSKDEMIDYLEKVRDEFYNLPNDIIALPTGVSEIDKHIENEFSYKKGTPAHVKAAIHHNKLISQLGLENKYEMIKNGDKIKMLILKEPNPLGNGVIAYRDFLPPEFDLEKWLDKEAQFNKIYLDGIKRIFDVIGYDTEKKNDSEDFF